MRHKDSKFNPTFTNFSSFNIFVFTNAYIDDLKSNNKINRYGDKESNWRTPLLTSKVSDAKPLFIM